MAEAGIGLCGDQTLRSGRPKDLDHPTRFGAAEQQLGPN
jgi:hypothetical protein